MSDREFVQAIEYLNDLLAQAADRFARRPGFCGSVKLPSGESLSFHSKRFWIQGTQELEHASARHRIEAASSLHELYRNCLTNQQTTAADARRAAAEVFQVIHLMTLEDEKHDG